MRRHPCDASWYDLAAFRNKFPEQVRILIVDRLSRNIDSAPGHCAICAPESRAAFCVFWLHNESTNFPMKRPTAQKRVVLLLFEPVRRVGALLVAGRNVSRSGLSFSLGLRAFENYFVARHDV